MPERTPRKDAARNREAVLAAADALFARCESPEDVTMAGIAAAAGVGKGTLFRGFGDRAGLLRALYEARLEPVRQAAETGPRPWARRPRRGSAYPPCSMPSCASNSTTGASRWPWRRTGAAARTGRSTTNGGTACSEPCWSRSPA